jgi:hypothetical protein
MFQGTRHAPVATPNSKEARVRGRLDDRNPSEPTATARAFGHRTTHVISLLPTATIYQGRGGPKKTPSSGRTMPSETKRSVEEVQLRCLPIEVTGKKIIYRQRCTRNSLLVGIVEAITIS